jgi:putative aldouronate transport system substrate-binding protein
MKRICAVLLSVLMLLGSAAFAEDIVNPIGYPIVNETITLEVAIQYDANRGDVSQYNLWEKIEALTGIQIEVRFLNDTENVALMYATQDFPDILLLSGTTSLQFVEAVESGDLIAIDQYYDYMPNTKAFLDAHPEFKQLLTYSDGHIYHQSYLEYIDSTINLRDCWFVNGEWLKELGLEMPTTINEFTNYLRAVRDNAGKGTIPENVIPYFYRHDEALGGPQEIYTSFGLFQGTWDMYIEDGVVKHNYTNPDWIEAIEYEKLLYSEKLTVPEMFTADWGTYLSYRNAAKCMTGSISGFVPSTGWYWDFMAPLDCGIKGRVATIRTQKLRSSLTFMITSACKYPMAAARWADALLEEDILLHAMYGANGYQKTENGEWRQTGISNDDPDMVNWGLNNVLPLMLSPELMAELKTADAENPKTREWAYRNIYADKTGATETRFIFPSIPVLYYDAEDYEYANQISTDVSSYVKQITAKWIIGERDVRADWDEFVQELDNLGWNKYLAIHQAAYDAFVAESNN